MQPPVDDQLHQMQRLGMGEEGSSSTTLWNSQSTQLTFPLGKHKGRMLQMWQTNTAVSVVHVTKDLFSHTLLPSRMVWRPLHLAASVRGTGLPPASTEQHVILPTTTHLPVATEIKSIL